MVRRTVELELYPHNESAYRAALALLTENGKAAVIHPTGTGKSYIAFKLVQAHPESRICWLSPSAYIFRTQLENVTRDFPGLDFSNIQFFTYSKLLGLPAEELQVLRPDFIILDEFHRCGAQRWSQGVARLLALYPAAQLLGLSATNIRYLDNQRDMADELFAGNIASELSLSDAIARGILPSPKYVMTVYSYEKELERCRRRVAAVSEKPLRDAGEQLLEQLRRALEQADGLDEVFAKHMAGPGKYLAFCADLEHLRQMQAQVPAWFGRVDPQPHVYTAYADDPDTSAEFAAFKADGSRHLRLLFCIDMLNEGVHVDDIDGVILFRPTVSPILYKQQIGRALCAGGHKTPLIFDVVNNFENLAGIDALESEVLASAFQFYGTQEAAEQAAQRFQIFDEVRDCRRLFAQLEESLAAGWEQHYRAAAAYRRRYGDLRVPKRYVTPEGLSLGQWLVTQRRVRAGQVAGSLSPQRIARLDALGMDWNNRHETAWERGYAAAQAYREQYGDLNVPARYTAPDGYPLGSWIVNQRQARAAHGQTATLTPQRIARLDTLGMVWDAVSVQWEKNFAAAAAYYAQHGDLDVPTGYKTPEGLALGKWLHYQRMARAGVNKGAKPTPEQILRLDAIGMCWQDRYAARWQQNYATAKRYFERNGNLDVPVTYKTPDGLALGKWLYRQKRAQAGKEKPLTPEQRQKLSALGL